MKSNDEIERILYLLGEEDKSVWQGAVAPTINHSSNFAFGSVSDLRDALDSEKYVSLYTRGHNPTVRLAELKLAALQHTEDALLFGSGSAAIAAAVIALVSAGDHVICVRQAYSWTRKLLDPLMARFGVAHTFVNGTDTEAVKAARQANTRLLILESPTSFMFELQDIEACVAWANEAGIKVLADNSYGSPLHTLPADLGVDLIAHSATKFIGGHSDAVAGLLCGSRTLMEEIFRGPYMTLGAALSPFNAWLLLRGLRTLPLRMERSGCTCAAVVGHLKRRPWVRNVIWPFDETHPQHDLAMRQYSVRPSMFSLVLNTDRPEAAERFCNALRVFQMAVSWGGYESLALPAVAFDQTEWPVGFIRLYIGLESAEMLIKDLNQAATAAGL